MIPKLSSSLLPGQPPLAGSGAGLTIAELLLQHLQHLRHPEQQGPQGQPVLAWPWTLSLQHYRGVQAQAGMEPGAQLLICWKADIFSLQASPRHSKGKVGVRKGDDGHI